MATPIQVQLQVQALRLEKRRLKEEHRLLIQTVQAARINFQSVTSKIEAKTTVRDDKRQRVYCEHLMHKREHYKQLCQDTELEEAAKRRFAQSRLELEDH